MLLKCTPLDEDMFGFLPLTRLFQRPRSTNFVQTFGPSFSPGLYKKGEMQSRFPTGKKKQRGGKAPGFFYFENEV